MDWPEDFPQPRNTDLWCKHDRLLRHNYVNAGIGVDWRFDRKQSLSFAIMHMIEAEQVHIMDIAASLTFARSF